MHVLITRPEDDAALLRQKLRTSGHRVTLAPMMRIVPRDPAVNLEGFQAILLTSANGARALARLTTVRDLPVLAVGDATARTARAHGFVRVEAAGGDVHSLARLAADRLDPDAGPLFHGAGKVVAGDLAALLAPHGFTVRRTVLYDARAAMDLPPAAVAAIRDGLIDIALFYSPRTARIFCDLASRSDVVAALGQVTAAALSPAVRDALQSVAWRRIVTALEPNEPALMKAAALDTTNTDGGENGT